MEENKDNALMGERWRVSDFNEEDRVEDTRPICPRCEGNGRVREWSTPFFILAAVGLVGTLACLYKLVTAASEDNGRYGLGAFVLLCLFVFGAFPLIDRSECSRCSGMGRLDADDAKAVDEYEDDDEDDDGERAGHAPPE